MAHRRIVIDFDDEGEASGADGAGGGLLGSAHAAAADATGSSHGVLGTGSNKPADLLRSIQNMRMTLKRLEQQKQQHAAGATLAASAGSNSGGVLDKHIALQLQMERLRQEIEQKNSQLQRMPKPGIARAGTPPAPALFGAPAPLVVASSAPAGRAHLGRSISLPGASELAGGGLEQEPPPQQQQQFALSKQQQLGKQRSDVGPIAGHDERISGAPPTAKAHRLPEQQDAAEAADAFLLSLQAQNDGEPAQRPAVQEGLGPPVSANQQQELHGAASSRKDCQQQMDLPDLLPVQPPDKAAARRQPAADTLAAPRAVAAAGLVDAATAQATPARAATLSAPGAQGGPSESKAAPAAEDPASPLQQLTALPLDPQPEPGTSGRGAANAGSGGAGAAREAADGQPVAMLPAGLLQALLPAERRVGADAELATIRAQKQQALLKRQVLRQLLQDAAQAWDQLCAQERQLLRKMGHEESQAQPQEAAAALPSSVADAAGQRRRRQLAALAAASTERLQRAQLSVAAQAARHMQGGMQRRLPGAQLLKDAHGADAPAACIPPGVPTPEAGAAGPAEPALMQAVAAVGEQEALGGSGQQQVAALVHEQSVPKQAALRPLQAAASGRKRGRSRSCSESQGRCRAAPGCRRPVAATRGPSRASSSSFSSSSSYSSTSGSTSSSSSMSKSMTSSSREAPAGQKARGRAPGRPGSGASVEPQSRSGSRGLANRGDQRGRSKERGLPQTCPIVRRSPTPDAAPPAVVAAAHNGPSKSTPRSGAAAALEQSKKQGAGAAKEANGGSGAGGASRLPLRIPDSVRRLFLQGLQRCCKLWHLPFSAYRIEGQMERLKHGFVCRQELGASFSQLLLAMQREGHMQLDMSDASPSRWRVTTVPKTPGAPDRERVAAPASSRPGSRQEGAAALAPAAQPSREGGSAAAVAPPASSVPGEQQHQLQQSVPEGVDTTCAAGTAAAPIRFSIRGNSRASVGAGAATAKSGAAAAGSGAPSAAQPAALAAGGAAAPPSATPFAVLQVPSGRAPWQKLAAAKATAAASLAAATDAAPAPAAIPDGSAAGASPQPTGGGASQLPSPAADMPSVAAAESPQSSPVKPASAVASAVQAASPVPAAAADGGEGQPSPGLRRHIMRQQSAAARPELQPQKNAPAARPLLAAAAAAAGSIKAAATAVDVARTSAAFKFAAAELQQRRQAQGAPGARVEEQARQQDQQTQQQALQGAAQQPVRVILLVSSSSAASGKEHVRLLITPHLAPPPAPPSRPQGLAQHSQLGQGPPLGLVPPAQAATSLPSVVGQPSALHASGVPPWARPAQAPAQQQPKLWQQPQQPQQQFGAQLLAAIPQHGHPADRANSAGGRQLSDYGDLAGSSVATRGTSRGAGRHLPVFASDGGPSNGAGPGRRPAMLGSPPLPPWLQGVHASYAQAPPAHATLLAQLEGCLRPRHSNVAIPASASSILGNGGLLSEAVASAVLRHEPSGGRAGGGAGAARSGVAHAAVRAPKPAPLLADWPMCPFELRGSCRDAACRFQMAADQQVLQAALSSPQRQHTQRTQEQQQAVVASEAASARRPGLAMPGATQPQPKRRRVSDLTVQAVALEQQLPVYAVSKQCAAGLGSSCTSASAARADQPFASLLLGPAVLLQLPLALSASGVSSMSAALRWQLLPGGGAVSGHMLRSQQHQQASAVSQQAQAEAGAGSSGRYFGAPAAQHGSQAERERPYWQRQYDELLQQRPEDDEVWLSYAVRHAVEACSSKVCALSLALREQMLLVLKRGLEHNRHSAVLWPLYLHLYCQQPGCAAGMMVDTALQFAPHSYRLWLVAAEQQRQWQEAATVLQRGVLALCRPVLTGGSAGAGGAGVGGKSLPEPQAAAALDLGLRLLHLLSMADQPDSSSQLVQWAGGDLAGSGSLLLRSKAALLAELQPHPRLFATLCCCCAYAAAYGCLPGPAQHSLGYQQASLSELLRDWPELPGQHHQHQQAACRAALVAGADSLGLLGHSSGNLLHQERGLAAAQHGRMLESLRQAQQAQPEALCAAQSALLLAVLRLDRIAGASGPAGSSLMVQLVGFTSGMPSSQASSLAPPQQAALAVTQQRWHAFAGWAEPKLQQGPNSAGVQQSRQLGSPALQEERRVLIQPPAELVQLMQETVVAAALSAAAPSTGGNLPLLACVQGKLHPAAAAALMAAVAGGDTAGAPNSALQLLSHWSVAYEARNPSQAWPWCAQPLDSLLASSNTFPAAGITDEQLGAAAAAALQRLAAAQHAQDVEERPRRLPGPAAKDAAAIFYSCWVAVLHSLLQPCTPPAAGQRCPVLPALRAAARAWQSGGEGMQQLGQLEVAALSLLAAAAPGAAAAEAAAAAKWVRGGARQRQALLWPPPRQPGWLDPLAAAALAPPAAAAPCVPPPSLVRQLPQRLQVLLLESALPVCSPAVASAAVAAALQAAKAAAASEAAGGEQEQRSSLWRHPVLGWALPVAASALASSVPAAQPALWHQVVALAAALSPMAAAELSAAATTVHPYSLRLWQQRHHLLSATPVGAQKPAAAVEEAQQRGLALPPPWQQQPAISWNSTSP